jgi:beta-glucosidase
VTTRRKVLKYAGLGLGAAAASAIGLTALPVGSYVTLAVPLSCFSAQDLMKTPSIAHLEASGSLDVSVSEIRLRETRTAAACPTK